MVEDVLVVLALFAGFMGFALNVYGAVDARATPKEVFDAVGQSRTLWMTLTLVGPFLLVIGVGIGCYYVLRVRPDLRRELVARGLMDEVSPRTTLVWYVLPALALAAAVALNANSEG